MDLNADFKTYQERITSSLVNVTRTASQLANQDLGFHRSSSDKFSQSLDAQSAHLLRLTNKLLKAAAKDTPLHTPNLQDRDGIEDNWRSVVDVIDDLLEKADRSLDEFTGVIKRLSPTRHDVPESSTKNTRQGRGFEQPAQNSMPKPQLSFVRKVNNYETEPWRPLLATKPHANMPLEDSIGAGNGGFKHPYAHEIQNMIYPNSVYNISTPAPYYPPEESEPIWVDTEEAVLDMLNELKHAKEIAIDLEHNDKNSYIGLVCLMQISTRDKDWIVDTLKPWRENLQVLNEVFANPRIVKVLHGSNSDIIWLQRDLGLYIVGLFDTYHASNVLQFPSKSLKYLLERFADFEAQKQYQLSDWRVRPLPQELIDYARSDTHYLLYIYDNLRNMLIEASTPHDNFVEHVLDASRREALQVYERPIYDIEQGLNPGGWMRLLLQRSTHLTNEQLGVFRALHSWRDSKARELDEGDQNIMPNTMIWILAEAMPTYKGAFFQRGIGGRLPRYVAEYIPEIIEAVKQGMASGKEGPSVHELIEKNSNKAGYMFGRNKYIRKKTDEPASGVSATLQMLKNTGELVSTPTASEGPETTSVVPDEPVALRAALSQLWGAVQPSNIQATASSNVISQALQIILPLQSLVHKPFTPSGPSATLPVPTTQETPLQTSNGTDPKPEDVFVLRDRTRKRKLSDTLDAIEIDDAIEQPSSEDVISLSTGSPPQIADSETQTRRQSKRARKAEKQAKRAAEAQERAAAQANMVPFDYANAESILHAKSNSTTNGDANRKQGKNKPMNPFARALDTSTGAKRNKMGKELAGRSHTFKG